jgi:hypothetical protein
MLFIEKELFYSRFKVIKDEYATFSKYSKAVKEGNAPAESPIFTVIPPDRITELFYQAIGRLNPQAKVLN